MTHTPRTESAALVWGPHTAIIGTTVPVEFARELERELGEAMGKITGYQKAISNLRYESDQYHNICGVMWRALGDKPDKAGNPCHISLINERNALRERLATLLDCISECKIPEHVIQDAKNALHDPAH